MLHLRRLGMSGKLKRITIPPEICVVCFENEATFTCIPCTHRVLCSICVEEYRNRKYESCPICRISLRNFSEKK